MVPRIRQIQIQNFKSIERAVVDLEPFTAFVGPNGAGKSTFVDALAFVQGCLSQSVEQAFRKRGGTGLFPRWIEPPYRTLGIRLLIDLPDGSTADYAFESSRTAKEGSRILRERCTVQAEGAEVGFEVSEGRFVRPIAGIRPQLAQDHLALFVASATEEFRPLYDFLTSIRFYSIQPLRMMGISELDSPGSLDWHGGNAAAVLKSLQDRDRDAYARVVRMLSRIVEGVHGIEVQADHQELFLEFRKDIGSGEPVRLYPFEMSEGTLRVLGLLLAVYQPNSPSVLLIEEPESTIHPAAAELVVQILLDAARDRQVLITTHSPDILDAKELSDEQIRVVTMERGRTIIAPLSQATRGAIRERLYTPGELLRIDELSQDLEAAKDAAQRLNLFGDAAVSLTP